MLYTHPSSLAVPDSPFSAVSQPKNKLQFNDQLPYERKIQRSEQSMQLTVLKTVQGFL